jgi:hypothetical protein
LKQKILEALRPGTSWWALVGIVVFFILPEVAAVWFGDEIKAYFHLLSQEASDPFLAKAYKQMESLGEFSWLNFLLGVGFVGWFLAERFARRKP